MYTHISPNAAKKIASVGCKNVEALRYLRHTANIDLGVCGVSRIEIRDSQQFLYIDTREQTAAVSPSLADWMDNCWDGGAADYAHNGF